MDYQEYIKAYKTAQHQCTCHDEGVSGCWSIDGEEFCERYNLDYDELRQYEDECTRNDFADYIVDEQAKIRRKIGELTDEQTMMLEERLGAEWDFEEEGSYFWWYAKQRLAELYPEYDARYYKEKEFKR